MKIVESPTSVWFYHLSKDGETTLCGKTGMMQTQLPLNTWGFRSHIGEKYCKDCNNFVNGQKGVSTRLLRPIPQEWIRDYTDSLVKAAESFGNTPMGQRALERAEHIMDMVEAFRKKEVGASE